MKITCISDLFMVLCNSQDFKTQIQICGFVKSKIHPITSIHRPRIKIKISLILTSRPTCAHTFLSTLVYLHLDKEILASRPTSTHTFLSTLGDLHLDKKRSFGVSGDFICPVSSNHQAPRPGIHCQLAETQPWDPLSHCLIVFNDKICI